MTAPHDHIFAQTLLVDLCGACQDPQRDRQVVSRTFLADIRWRHVHGDLVSRVVELAITQSRDDAFMTFLHRTIGQPYEVKIDSGTQVHLHGDRRGMNTIDGTPIRFNEHTPLRLDNIIPHAESVNQNR